MSTTAITASQARALADRYGEGEKARRRAYDQVRWAAKLGLRTVSLEIRDDDVRECVESDLLLLGFVVEDRHDAGTLAVRW